MRSQSKYAPDPAKTLQRIENFSPAITIHLIEFLKKINCLLTDSTVTGVDHTVDNAWDGPGAVSWWVSVQLVRCNLPAADRHFAGGRTLVTDGNIETQFDMASGA